MNKGELSARRLTIKARADFFVLRTPLFPFDAHDQWGKPLAASAASGAALADAIAIDRRRLRDQLIAIFNRPDAREALYLASSDFEAIYSDWVQSGSPDNAAGQRIERTLARYFARMCARSTPFGLFAGCSVGAIGTATTLQLNPAELNHAHVRLDCDLLDSLVSALRQHPVRNELTHTVNATLRVLGERVLYTASVDGLRAFREESAELDSTLRLVLDQVGAGNSPARIAEVLAQSLPDSTPEETLAYVHELIDAGILEPAIAIPVTGPEPLPGLIDALLHTVHGTRIAGALQGVQAGLEQLRASAIGHGVHNYRRLAASVAELPGAQSATHTFQVDMVKPVRTASLGQDIVDEILLGAEALRRLGPTHDALEDFKKRFIERFGAEEAPFLDVIDHETGVWRSEESLYASRPDSDLIDGLKFPTAPGTRRVPWGKREELLLELIERAGSGSTAEVALDIDDLAPLVADALPFPRAFAVTATILGDRGSLERHAARVHVKWMSGPSGARLLARFCHADPELQSRVAEHLRAEQDLIPDAIIAEVAHHPEGRLGNVLLRPLLRDYEIVYFGKSGISPDRQIHVSDLMVSVVSRQVVLRSKRLNRRIIPSVTNAMALPHTVPGYEFLCRIATQGGCWEGGFNWSPFNQRKQFPRLVMGRVILSPQRWHLSSEDLSGLIGKNGVDLFNALTPLRNAYGLPRHALLMQDDAMLPVDFDNVLSIEAFAHLVRKRSDAHISEMLASPDNLCVEGPEGRYTHEIVVPFVEERDAIASPAPLVHSGSSTTKHFPGSRWFYAKCYVPSSQQDRAIVSVLPHILDPLKRQGLIANWFFVRYADPDTHLRLRICGESESIALAALPLLNEAVRLFNESGAIHKVELTTYEPEVQRYGGEAGLAIAEQLFCLDSEFAITALSAPPAEQPEAAWRWQIALRSAHALLEDFQLSLSERLQYARDTYGGLTSGPRPSSAADIDAFVHQLGDKFRQLRPTIDGIVGAAWPPSGFERVADALLLRSEAVKPLSEQLLCLSRSGDLGVSIEQWLGSVIHMAANRLFPSNAREHEIAMADVLRRAYEGQIARHSRRSI